MMKYKKQRSITECQKKEWGGGATAMQCVMMSEQLNTVDTDAEPPALKFMARLFFKFKLWRGNTGSQSSSSRDAIRTFCVGHR